MKNARLTGNDEPDSNNKLNYPSRRQKTQIVFLTKKKQKKLEKAQAQAELKLEKKRLKEEKRQEKKNKVKSKKSKSKKSLPIDTSNLSIKAEREIQHED